MPQKRPGLGKGLDALIPPSERAIPVSGIKEVPITDIIANPRQPREKIDPQELAELATSIREHGILQPLIVTQSPGVNQYVLIAGERRLEAARHAGLDTVPVILREASEQDFVELALIENVQRTDLNPLETAEAFRQLVEDFGLSHEQIADRVGKSRTTITNTLRLLKLPKNVQGALLSGEISEGHARALLGLPTPQAQSGALQTITKRELNVRQTEELVRKLTGDVPPPTPKREALPEIKELEDRLRAALSTQVHVTQSGKGGRIVIYYYSDEELEALLGRLLRE
ncbi:MAG: ParB/RepB/Spo0J family partition protein [Chloroflexota bacterium]